MITNYLYEMDTFQSLEHFDLEYILDLCNNYSKLHHHMLENQCLVLVFHYFHGNPHHSIPFLEKQIYSWIFDFHSGPFLQKRRKPYWAP